MSDLEAQLEQAKAKNAILKAEICRLKQRIAELERTAKRQATPFARDEHTPNPKRPGRKAGQGLFSYREKPTSGQIDETKGTQLERCPECGGALTNLKEQSSSSLTFLTSKLRSRDM